jgi:hypothetical protein
VARDEGRPAHRGGKRAAEGDPPPHVDAQLKFHWYFVYPATNALELS